MGWAGSSLHSLYMWQVREVLALSFHFFCWPYLRGFPGGSSDKESACQCRRPGFNPGLGRSPRERNGNPVQYSCLGSPLERGDWRASLRGHQESDTTGHAGMQAFSPLPHLPSLLSPESMWLLWGGCSWFYLERLPFAKHGVEMMFWIPLLFTSCGFYLTE